MGFVSFLKKAGLIAAKVAIGWDLSKNTVKAIAPDHIDAIIDRVDPFLMGGIDIVLQAEVFGNALALTGEQKLTGATDAFAQLVLKTDFMTGKKIENPELFAEAARDYANATAKLLNSLSADSLPDAD